MASEPRTHHPPTVGILGLGYVGLPLAAAFARGGFRVLGFDRDAERLRALGAGRSPLPHLDASEWRGVLEPTADLERVGECEALFLCLPTPLDGDGEPDLAALHAAGADLRGRLRPDQLCVLTSTVPPRTTREVLFEALGRHRHLAFSPEREDPGAGRDARQVPRLVAGFDAASRAHAERLLDAAGLPTHGVASLEVAEAAKLWENLFRSVNCALANELAVRLTALELDPNEVLDAAATKPFGFLPFTPGPGPGGPCIPYVTRFLPPAPEADAAPNLFAAVEASHRAMPGWTIERLRLALAERGVPLASARVLVCGVAYKAGVSDVRGSAALALLHGLAAQGTEIAYHDPLVPRLELHTDRRLTSQPLAGPAAEREVARFDAVVVLHAAVAETRGVIARGARLVLDPCGALRRELEGDSRRRI